MGDGWQKLQKGEGGMCWTITTKTGIGLIRFHDLRHTSASLLIEQGENIKYIQKQLGHSSPTATLNVYAHLMRPVNHEAMARLEDTVFGAGDGHSLGTVGEKNNSGFL